MVPKAKKFIEKGVPSIKVSEIENSKGYVELKMDPGIRKMAREISKMSDQMTPLLNVANDAAKEVTYHLDKLAEGYNKLGSACQNIQKLYQSTSEKFTELDSFTKLTSLYTELASTFTNYSKVLFTERDNFGTNIESFFAYSQCEVEGLEEVSGAKAAAGDAQRLLRGV